MFVISRLTNSETSAVLATMLTNQTAKKLLSLIEQMNQKKSASINRSDSSSEKKEDSPSEVAPVKGNAEKLKVVTLKELMSILTSMDMVDERERHDV